MAMNIQRSYLLRRARNNRSVTNIAGESRGFVVVAGEVRSLAQRSAAAKEIKALIDTSVERVQSGNSLVDEAGRTMNEIIGAVQRVNDIMGEIAAASEEQGSGICCCPLILLARSVCPLTLLMRVR
jgi:Methyl-accepting chemotaxis protein (MCP) signalling domain